MCTKLTSVDYARLIQYTAAKMCKILLNKTQVNKILFYVYGAYLADTGKCLFDDDTPKAWTYGPVFPIPNKRIKSGEEIELSDIPKEKINVFKENQIAVKLIKEAVSNMSNKTAVELSRWSHEKGAPWDKTIYERDDKGTVVQQHAWNTIVESKIIEDYFKNKKNRIFDGK